MSELSERYRKVAGTFTERAEGVPADGWDAPAPPEGWVARDVVRHLVEWVPSLLFGPAGLELPAGLSVDDDPVGAWKAFDAVLQGALDDPDVSAVEIDILPGHFRVDAAIDMLVTSDVLVHTWDLARATGQDETIDADESLRMYEGMLPMDEVLRQSGHYGPAVDVPDDADAQTKLIAFTGRRP